MPEDVAQDIVKLLLKKPKHRENTLRCIGTALRLGESQRKIQQFQLLDGWSVVTDEQLKSVLESVGMSDYEKSNLVDMISRVGAYKPEPSTPVEINWDDEVPF